MSEFQHTGSEQAFTGGAGGHDGDPLGGGAAPGPEGAGGFTGGELDGDGEFNALGVADPLASDTQEKKSHSGVLVLILVVGLAIGSLFSMHTLTKVTASSGRDTDIEKTIEDFLNSMGAETGVPGVEGTGVDLANEHGEVVQILTDNYTENQIKDLDRNPFQLFSSGQADTGGGTEQADVSTTMLTEAVSKLNLKSVIMGSRPLANINGRIVRVNKELVVPLPARMGTARFKVVSITSDSVTIQAVDSDFSHVLRLNKNR